MLAALFVCLPVAGTTLSAQQTASVPVATALAPIPNTLLDGTAIKLRLAETLTSATAKVGQSVAFEVVDEFDVMGVPVIAKGAQAQATVTIAETKKSMGRGGKLDVNIDTVRLIDGEKAALRATEGGKGGGHTGAMTAGIVGTAIIFFPAAPLLLFIHGKDITIPKGTEVTAFVAGDMHLAMDKFVMPGTAAPVVAVTVSPVPAANAETTASLSVDSSVPGADIEVDGVFAGSTPSLLSILPGQHTIVVKKKGYVVWSRTMNVAGTGVKLSADLETLPE